MECLHNTESDTNLLIEGEAAERADKTRHLGHPRTTTRGLEGERDGGRSE